MAISRRQFLGAAVSTGAALTVSCSTKNGETSVGGAEAQVVPAPKGEWVAASPASAYRGYRSKLAKTADATTWVQIDLGMSRPIDSVKVYPANDRMHRGRYYAGEGFPVRFKIEVSEHSDLHNAKAVVDHTGTDFPNPQGYVQNYHAGGVKGRYLRLTATRLMHVKGRTVLGNPPAHYYLALAKNGAGIAAPPDGYYMALTKIGVYSDGKEIAAERPVTVDKTYGNYDDVAQVTRAERAGGEGVYWDHPENVTQASTWKPPRYKARKPLRGVSLNGGLFQTAMENNIDYLLNSYTVDELLRQFRDRAGIPNPPGLPPPKTKFWEEDLAGSNAGRFLMGAGNTLRWIDHPELRRRLNAVVDGIARCSEPDGYMMAYPKDTIFFSERGAYTRAWVTHGLIEAGHAGNQKAFDLLRGYYDWFNRCPYLPYMARFGIQGGQGMIANTRLYFTAVGKPTDIQVIQRYFQENYWLDQLAAHDDRALWQYPYDRPHCYLLTNVLAYLDLYRATGNPRYLKAVKGCWDLFQKNWEYPGGATAIKEFIVCPPKSYLLYARIEELCGSVFWAFLNQRLHELDPGEEAYSSEIEKSIYNVALADQPGSKGFRQFAWLTHHKRKPKEINTCCEGQGTRLIGSLPEHIYSIAADGIYVNLFEPSTINWKQHGQDLSLKMTTRFPFDSDVKLEFSAVKSTQAKIRVRVPSWAAREMEVQVNGKVATRGPAGGYVVIDRTWSNGDTVSFTLPAALRMTLYTGVDQSPDHERYYMEYGPILLAAVGAAEVRLKMGKGAKVESLLKMLQPKPGQPLHYKVENNPGIEFMPYWQVEQQPFNCFPSLIMNA